MLKLSGLFSEGAVLQRDRSIPVWGWSAPHAIVDGRLGGVPARTRAGSDGRFLLRFPPRSAGGPHVLTVSADGETVEVTDLLVGEVWVAGGQSNMEFRLRDIPEKLEHARKMASSLRQVRMITIPHRLSLTPAADVQASWQVATSDGVDDWSAVGFYFAERMHRELGVPVGIISSNWGGTIAEEQGRTSREGVLAGGDAVTGAATVILAMGAGKAAAEAMDEYVKNKAAR